MSYNALLHLTKAPSKKYVDSLFITVRADTHNTHDIQADLQVGEEEANQLVAAIKNLINQYLRDTLVRLLGADFQANLRDLLDRILAHHAQEWRDLAISSQPSLPKIGSEAISRMSVPTVLVDLKVSKPPTQVNSAASTESVVFELNIETINTIMDSLKFVQGQLNSIK